MLSKKKEETNWFAIGAGVLALGVGALASFAAGFATGREYEKSEAKRVASGEEKVEETPLDKLAKMTQQLQSTAEVIKETKKESSPEPIEA